MGLFDFNKSTTNSNSKGVIKVCAYQISSALTKLKKIPQSTWATDPQARYFASIIKLEAKKLNDVIAPNRKTDWDLLNNTQVETFDGEVIDLSLFIARLDNQNVVFEHYGLGSIRIWV